MPSSNVRDGLPAHYDTVRRLREVAAAVIQAAGWQHRGRARAAIRVQADVLRHAAQDQSESNPARAAVSANPDRPALTGERGEEAQRLLGDHQRHQG